MLAPRPTLPVLGQCSTERLSRLLRTYFYSGWAFFIPYLVAYLLYAVLKWPVNPSMVSLSAAGLFRPPALLHVYWLLHAVHFITGAGVLWKVLASWPLGKRPDLLQPVLPWLLIGFVLWIPGTYLEFPADPWEHLRRINEWAWHDTIGQHTYWTKSTYFTAFSLIGRATTFKTQVAYLDLFQTSTGFLLSWQYYRLALVTGLPRSGAMLVAIAQLLLAGNSVFGFHRYYGVASTEIAHIGALAFIRGVIVWCKAKTTKARVTTPLGPSSSAKLVVQTLSLLGLVTFSHLQGLGIMAMGAAATTCWWLVERRRLNLMWLILVAIGASVLVLVGFPHDESVQAGLRASRWLSPWYGLNLLSPNSPAGLRSIAVLGMFGVIELAPATWLICRRNHLAGWLCLTPLFLLSLPAVAIPLVTALLTKGDTEILVFHRFLFAIPTGLVGVTFGYSCVFSDLRVSQESAPTFFRFGMRRTALSFCTIIAATLTLVLVPPSEPYFNRFWHILFVPPADLQMAHISEALDKPPIDRRNATSSLLLATRAPAFVAVASGRSKNSPLAGRLIHTAQPADYLPWFYAALDDESLRSDTTLLYVDPLSTYSPISLAGYVSNLWLPQEAAIYNTVMASRPFAGRWKIPQREATSYADLVPLEQKTVAPLPKKTD